MKKAKANVISLPTSNPFRPQVVQYGNSLDEIVQHIKTGSHVHYVLYPPHVVAELKKAIKSVSEYIRDYFKHSQEGLVFFGRNLGVSLNLTRALLVPGMALWDVLLLSSIEPPLLITFAHEQNKEITTYNNSLAKEITFTLRDYTSENFNILCTVVKVDSPEEFSFMKIVHKLKEEKLQYCIPGNLRMTNKKWEELFRGLVVASACLTGLFLLIRNEDRENFDKNSHRLMTVEQFSELFENIDHIQSTSTTDAFETEDVIIAVEVCKRMKISGKTYCVWQWQENKELDSVCWRNSEFFPNEESQNQTCIDGKDKYIVRDSLHSPPEDKEDKRKVDAERKENIKKRKRRGREEVIESKEVVAEKDHFLEQRKEATTEQINRIRAATYSHQQSADYFRLLTLAIFVPAFYFFNSASLTAITVLPLVLVVMFAFRIRVRFEENYNKLPVKIGSQS